MGITITQNLTRTEAERLYVERLTGGALSRISNADLGDRLDELEPVIPFLGREYNYLIRDDDEEMPAS